MFTALLFGYTVYLIYNNPKFIFQLQSSLEVLLSNSKQVPIYIVIFFSVINWTIEGYKWKILVNPAVNITVYQGLRSVLIGLGTGFFTPMNIGEYFGRLFSLPAEDKWVLTGAVIVNGMAQLFATLLFGLLGIVFIYHSQLLDRWDYLFGLSLFSILIILVLIWKRRLVLSWILTYFPFVHKILKIIYTYKISLITEVYLWSFARHVVYSLQFIWILQILDPSISFWTILPYVSLVYLSKTLVPSFNFLSDLGVREFSSIFFLGLCGVAPEVALSAGMFIWVVNLLLPSLLGGILIWRK